MLTFDRACVNIKQVWIDLHIQARCFGSLIYETEHLHINYADRFEKKKITKWRTLF